MAEITLNLDQYNLLFEKAMCFEKIVEAVKANIDKNEIYPVKGDDILLLTGLNKYLYDHVQEIANSAQAKIATQLDAEVKTLKEQLETYRTQIRALNEQIELMQMKTEPETRMEETEEGTEDAEDQTEL